jgi:iron-sulfur cluster assembly protein
MNALPEGDPGLIISDSALVYLKEMLKAETEDQPIGVRVNVKKAGCSGYEYDLNFAYIDTQKPYDFAFERDSIKVLIDQEIYLKFFKGGTTLEYVKEDLNEGLQFKNPNVVGQCGCGESFTLASE